MMRREQVGPSVHHRQAECGCGRDGDTSNASARAAAPGSAPRPCSRPHAIVDSPSRRRQHTPDSLIATSPAVRFQGFTSIWQRVTASWSFAFVPRPTRPRSPCIGRPAPQTIVGEALLSFSPAHSPDVERSASCMPMGGRSHCCDVGGRHAGSPAVPCARSRLTHPLDTASQPSIHGTRT
jgi:hypothetical protein